MGGLASAAGESGLTRPRWLVGAAAELAVAERAPTVWLLDINDAATLAAADAAPPLPGEPAGFAGHGDAAQRSLRRRLTRLLLAAASGTRADAVVIGRTAARAPVVEAPAGWHVSVAARWPAFAIGIAPTPIGIDIEAVTQPLPDDLFTKKEVGRLAARPAGERAHDGARRWAAKEAHAKWTGRPRDLDPATVETGDPPWVRSPLGETRCWPRDWGDHIVAVCTA